MELVKNNAYKALTLAQAFLAASDANTSAITNLASQFNALKGEYGKLRKENMALREQTIVLNSIAGKNLILHGITDTDHENNTTCISTVKTFFKCILKIDTKMVISHLRRWKDLHISYTDRQITQILFQKRRSDNYKFGFRIVDF